MAANAQRLGVLVGDPDEAGAAVGQHSLSRQRGLVVQRRCRLVQQQECGFERDADCQCHALCLTALRRGNGGNITTTPAS